MDHPSYLFIANSHPVARNVLIQPERATGSLKHMRHASFTILPGSTKFPAYSVDVYSPAPAKCIPEAPLIATLDFARFHRATAPKFKRNSCPSLQEGVL